MKKFPPYVTSLPVHELENIYCLPGVFKAIGQHLSLELPDIASLYDEFIAQAKGRFRGEFLAKQIIERFKRRCSGALDTVVNKLEVILGDELFSFSSFQQWVNKAKSWYSQHGANSANSVSLDAKGRHCMRGSDFMRACDDEAFPVTVYRVSTGSGLAFERRKDAQKTTDLDS